MLMPVLPAYRPRGLQDPAMWHQQSVGNRILAILQHGPAASVLLIMLPNNNFTDSACQVILQGAFYGVILGMSTQWASSSTGRRLDACAVHSSHLPIS